MATRVSKKHGLDCITLKGWIRHCIFILFLLCALIFFYFTFQLNMYFYCAVAGDHVSGKGAMTGGFYDGQSKLRFKNIIVQNTKSIVTKEKVLEDVKIQLQDILFHRSEIVFNRN